MVWQIFIVNGSATGILTAIILLFAVVFSFWLMRRDKEAKWNLILVAISFLAFSVIFSVLRMYLLPDLFNFAKHLFMTLSALIFASTLIIYIPKKTSRKK